MKKIYLLSVIAVSILAVFVCINTGKDKAMEANGGGINQTFAVLYSSPFQVGSEILVFNSQNRNVFF